MLYARALGGPAAELLCHSSSLDGDKVLEDGGDPRWGSWVPAPLHGGELSIHQAGPPPPGYLCTRNKLLLCLKQYFWGPFGTVLLLALTSIISALLKMEKKTVELQKGKVTEKLMFLQFFLWNWGF